MRTFKATAVNEQGYTFLFTFQHYNWNLIGEKAQDALTKLVDGDSLHKANGPWFIRSIDIGG